MTNKVVVVTGGGSGIGRGICHLFAQNNYSVVVSDINAEFADATVESIVVAGGTGSAFPADVVSGDEVKKLLEFAVNQYGRIDALIGAAGIWQGGTVLTVDPKIWDKVMEVNTKGLFWLSRHGFEYLKESMGSITSIASIAGLKGTRNTGAYNPSKAAVISMTKNIALDFSDAGIRVNCICPGFVETPMCAEVLDFNGGGDELLQTLIKNHPLGRLGTPDDVAQAALFLSSKEASWITGSAMVVDGGRLSGG